MFSLYFTQLFGSISENRPGWHKVPFVVMHHKCLQNNNVTSVELQMLANSIQKAQTLLRLKSKDWDIYKSAYLEDLMRISWRYIRQRQWEKISKKKHSFLQRVNIDERERKPCEGVVSPTFQLCPHQFPSIDVNLSRFGWN